jgi:hypothetical protein
MQAMTKYCRNCGAETIHICLEVSGIKLYICQTHSEFAARVSKQMSLFPANHVPVPPFEHNEMPIQARKVGDY